MVGKASDEKSVAVAPCDPGNVRWRSYEFTIPTTGQVMKLTFGLAGDHLVLSGVGPTLSLIAISDTEFGAPGVTIEIREETSPARLPTFSSQAVEGDFKAIRK